MLNDFTGADQVYIACGYTDLRKGIDGLNRSLVIREALDAWIAAHKDEYPESLGQYGK